MSSIYGIYYFDKERSVSPGDLEKMAAIMAHRGTEPSLVVKGNVGLGFSHAPSRGYPGSLISSNPGGERWAVLDGMIFNRDSLLEGMSLEKEGIVATPYDDAQLIEKSYQAHGIPFLGTLDGPFTLALWDRNEGQLILARDRFGAKPLYFREDKDGVVFSSEAKAIIAVSEEKPSVNYDAICEYITYRYVADGSTLFSGIHELRPGFCFAWKGTDRSESRYWPTIDSRREGNRRSLTKNMDQLDALIRKSIMKRTRSSKKIGANCSGGIDSGLVTSLASLVTGEDVHSFTVGFQERGWDERPYARLIGDRYRTLHHELVVSSGRFWSLLPKLNWHNDNPLSDPNSVLVFLLAEYAKEFVDTLLNGEGADEVFLGYPRYNILNICKIMGKYPWSMKAVLIRVLSMTKDRRIGKLVRALSEEARESLIHNSAFVSSEATDFVLRDGLRNSGFPCRRKLAKEFEGDDLLVCLMFYEIGTYMLSSLNRLDRMGMAAGLEATPVYLDNDLFEYSLNIPEDQKISLFRNKIVLRKLASRYLPEECMNMPKSGFGVPIAEWMRTDKNLKGLLRDLPERRAVGEVMLKDRLRTVIEGHISGRADHSELLWCVLNYAHWHEQYYGSR